MANKGTLKCITVIRNHKRRPILYNTKTQRALPVVVGERGGLSVKSPNAKTRRYISKKCNGRSSKPFANLIKSIQESKK